MLVNSSWLRAATELMDSSMWTYVSKDHTVPPVQTNRPCASGQSIQQDHESKNNKAEKIEQCRILIVDARSHEHLILDGFANLPNWLYAPIQFTSLPHPIV